MMSISSLVLFYLRLLFQGLRGSVAPELPAPL